MTDPAPNGERPVLWLVDPNLKDFVGHHFEYDRAVVDGAQAEGFAVRVLGHRDASDEISGLLPLKPCFTYDIWGVPPGDPAPDAGERRANLAFEDALNGALSEGPLNRDSIVFGHMVTARQLLGWGRFAKARCTVDGPALVLLLRYQPEFYQSPAATEGFRFLEAAAKVGRVRLSSDSARLAHQLERLTSLPVEVWPLPHTTDLQPAAAPRKGRTLRVVSMGNARDEKGILELFNAVRILDALGKGARFSFAFQVNDPTPELKPAIEAFAAESYRNVELIWEPLGSAAYVELLKSADVVAVPYWREIYSARTSGIFMEALAAGKPVICTDDTWMSDQLALAGAGIAVADRDDSALAAALLRALDNRHSLSAKACADAGKWLAIHNPASFMRALVHGIQAPTAAPNRPRAAILYPWGDAVQNAAGAALRVNLLARFLAARCSEVRLLGDGDHASVRRDRVVFESFPITQTIERTAPYRWISRFARHVLRARNGEEIYLLLLLLPRFSRSFQARVDEIVRNSDLIFLEYPFWAPLVAKACLTHGKRFVLTAHDVIADQVRHSAPLRWLTALFERRSMKLAPERLAVTPADAEKFAGWSVPTGVSPSTVDVDAASRRLPMDARDLLSRLSDLPPGPFFIFVGSKFGPNVDAAAKVRQIASELHGRRPDLGATLAVVGGCMEPMREPGFTALGRVDGLTLKLLYDHCMGVIIPLDAGSGSSLKTIEALAGGHVVIGTTKAFRGMPIPLEPVWICEDNTSAYPDLIARLIEAPAERIALVSAAERYRASLDFRAAFAPYLQIFPELAAIQPDVAHADEQYRSFVMAAARSARDSGLVHLAQALVEALLQESSDHGEASLLMAELLGASDRDRAGRLCEAAFMAGVDAVRVLRAESLLPPAPGRERVLTAAANIEAHRAWTVAGDLALRERLWKDFHAGQTDWVHWAASRVDRLQPGAATCDYAYLRARTAKQQSSHELEVEIERARIAIEKGFDVYWGSMLHGELLNRAGRTSEAVSAYARAARFVNDPGLIDMAERGGAEAAYAAAGNPLLARELAATGLSLWPENAHLSFILAEALKQRGEDLIRACELYRRAAGNYHLAARAYLGCSEVLNWIGEGEAAAVARQGALSSCRDDHERRAIQASLNAPALAPVQ